MNSSNTNYRDGEMIVYNNKQYLVFETCNGCRKLWAYDDNLCSHLFKWDRIGILKIVR